ncbi:MAG: helix-turn-helix domain-containing protein [Bdellovibrionota bacterium]
MPDIEPRMIPEQPLTYSVSQVAVMLNISRNYAYDLIQQNELPSIRFGRRILIPRLALEKILASALPLRT